MQLFACLVPKLTKKLIFRRNNMKLLKLTDFKVWLLVNCVCLWTTSKVAEGRHLREHEKTHKGLFRKKLIFRENLTKNFETMYLLSFLNYFYCRHQITQ